MVEKQPLCPLLARSNLTDREITKIIGGVIGGLIDLADIEAIRRAVIWWADTPEAWDALEQQKVMNAAMIAVAREQQGDNDA